MEKDLNVINKSGYYRLVALWAVSEGLLGGIIHSFKLPISGLIMGSLSVICISLIGWFYPQRGAILKATVWVAIFKMMLSPMSPTMAYIAVFFQGATGSLLLRPGKFFSARVILFSILALLESAIQRLLIMTIVYGKNIWTAIDSFISNLLNQEKLTHYSYMLAGIYILIHLIAAIFVARYILQIRNEINPGLPLPLRTGTTTQTEQPTKKSGARFLFPLLYFILALLYLQSYLSPEKAWLPNSTILNLLFRSLLILLSWKYLINPIIRVLLNRWLEKKKRQSASELNAVLFLIPSTQEIILESWKKSSTLRGLARIRYFIKNIFLLSFTHADR